MSMKSRIPHGTYMALMRRSRNRCEWCGSKDNCGIDHIWPRCHGGTNRKSNLQILCGRCGSWKGGDLPERILSRMKRLKVKSRWAQCVKDVGQKKMQEFLHKLELEKMEKEKPVVVDTFPNPLVITIGEGKVACQAVMTNSGGGIVFAILEESREVGSTGESIIGDELKQNQMLLLCRNRQGAEILKQLATHVCTMMESAEQLESLPDSHEDSNNEE